ncbi:MULTISPECIES: hypothetical protein [unclassified Microcoleus]
MNIISFLRPWLQEAKIACDADRRLSVNSYVKRGSGTPRPASFPSPRQKHLLIPNVSAGMRYLAGVIK